MRGLFAAIERVGALPRDRSPPPARAHEMQSKIFLASATRNRPRKTAAATDCRIQQRAATAAWQSLQRASKVETFTADRVESLPEPARRYLLHAMQTGAPLASSVEIEMRGKILLSPGGDWLPLEAREILTMPGGFVWRASIGGLFRFLGSDRYASGEGALRWCLWGVIPVAAADGEDITRSARGRLAAELIWLPSALLPQRGVRWKALDADTAQANFSIDGEPFQLALSLDAAGAVKSVALERWGNTDTEGRYQKIPFGALFTQEATFGGYTVPVEAEVGWWINTARYREFFRAEVVQANYQ